MKRGHRIPQHYFLLGLLLLFIGSCATQETTVTEPVDPPQQFSESGAKEVPENGGRFLMMIS